MLEVGMRQQGRISEWRDKQGFGFVHPHDGGDRAFVHISRVANRNRRPVEGDLITYDLVKDDKGRPQAHSVRFVADRHRARPSRENRMPHFYLFFAFLLGLPALVAIGYLHAVVLAVYAMASVVTFAAYANDKRAAQNGQWRTSESALHVLALIGGWPGALLAQEWLRHKSRTTRRHQVPWLRRLAIERTESVPARLLNNDGRAPGQWRPARCRPRRFHVPGVAAWPRVRPRAG
ncbi:MAG: DUF1294 domain-containing protein [Wenzhouxiangellaceae bacterium]